MILYPHIELYYQKLCKNMRYSDDVIQDLVVTCRILASKMPWWPKDNKFAVSLWWERQQEMNPGILQGKVRERLSGIQMLLVSWGQWQEVKWNKQMPRQAPPVTYNILNSPLCADTVSGKVATHNKVGRKHARLQDAQQTLWQKKYHFIPFLIFQSP